MSINAFNTEKMDKDYLRCVDQYCEEIETELTNQIPGKLRRLATHRPFGKIITKLLGLRVEVVPTNIAEDGLRTALYKKQDLIKIFVLLV